MNYYELLTTKNAVIAVTGAGAIYLLAKTLLAVLKSPSFKSRFSPLDYCPDPSARVIVPGELRRTLQSLHPSLDDAAKKAALHTITQCVFLKESEASTCTKDDIKLVASFLDDPNKLIKTEALNALNAFSRVLKFKIRIQEYIPKTLELVVSIWDDNLQAAGLQLMNGLQIPNDTHPKLKVLLPKFMDILLKAGTEAKVQVLRLLSTMAQRKDLLYDIMNCEVPPELLSLFQTSSPVNLLYEILVLVEQLNEGRLNSQYQSINRQYKHLSLHNILFSENSRLSDLLLALIIHPDEEVEMQACKVILSLQLSKEESKVISCLPFSADISSYSIDSTRSSHPNDTAFSNLTFSPRLTSTPAAIFVDDADHSFQALQGTEDTSQSSSPLQSTGSNLQAVGSSGSVHSQPADNIQAVPSSGSVRSLPADNLQAVPSSGSVRSQPADNLQAVASSGSVHSQPADNLQAVPSSGSARSQPADNLQAVPSSGSVRSQPADNLQAVPSSGTVRSQPANNLQAVASSGSVHSQPADNLQAVASSGSDHSQPADNLQTVASSGTVRSQPADNLQAVASSGSVHSQPANNLQAVASSGSIHSQPADNSQAVHSSGSVHSQPADNSQAVNSSIDISSHPADSTIPGSPVLAEPTEPSDVFQPIAASNSDEDSASG